MNAVASPACGSPLPGRRDVSRVASSAAAANPRSRLAAANRAQWADRLWPQAQAQDLVRSVRRVEHPKLKWAAGRGLRPLHPMRWAAGRLTWPRLAAVAGWQAPAEAAMAVRTEETE
jgi:hypothetical protein